jgi:hypothetical protein
MGPADLIFPRRRFRGPLRAAGGSMIDRERLIDIAFREGLLLVLSVLGATLFLNHQVLYMDGTRPGPVGWPAYAVSTLVIYGFAHAVSFVVGVRTGTASEGEGVCPECGQPLRAQPAGDVASPRHRPHVAPLIARPIPASPMAQLLPSWSPVNPPAPVIDDVVEALLLRVMMGTPRKPSTATNASPSPELSPPELASPVDRVRLHDGPARTQP